MQNFLPGNLIFGNPAFLFLIALSFCPAILAYYFKKKRSVSPSKLIIILQSLAVFLCVVSLADPKIKRYEESQNWLVLLDDSASMITQNTAPKLPENISFTIQKFAADLNPEPDKISQTNLTPALEFLASKILSQQATGAVIKTDGQFADSWRASAKHLKKVISKTDASFYIVPATPAVTFARIEKFTACRARETGKANLILTATANTIVTRKIEVLRLKNGRPEKLIFSKEFKMQPGNPVVIKLNDDAKVGRAQTWLARVLPADKFVQATARATVLPAVLKVAIVAAKPNKKYYEICRKFFPGKQIRMNFIPAKTAPEDKTNWLNYSAVLLASGDKNILSVSQQKALKQAALSGVGLIILGAPRQKNFREQVNPISKISPLIADPFRRSPLDLVVLLDASGSMNASVSDVGKIRKKFDLASQAVLSLKEHLSSEDSLAVITFANRSRRIYTSAGREIDFAKLARNLFRVKPFGTTKILPALERLSLISKTQKRKKIAIIVSDLETEKFDSGKIAAKLKADNWTVNLIATAPSKSGDQPAISKVVDLLEGRKVDCFDLKKLSKVFGQLCRKSRDEIIKNGSFEVLRTTGSELKSGEVDSYIVSSLAKQSDLLLQVKDAKKYEPFAAFRIAGLGKIFAVATAIDNASLQKLFNQIGVENELISISKTILRQSPERNFSIQTTRKNLQNKLIVTRNITGNFPRVQKLFIRVSSLKSGKKIGSFQMQQQSVNRWSCELPADSDELGVEIFAGVSSESKTASELLAQAVLPAKPAVEFQKLGTNWQNLRELEQLTGGKIVFENQLAKMKPASKIMKSHYLPIWQYLLACGVFAFLISWLFGINFRRA